MEINQNEIPTKSSGSSVDEDANALVQVNPRSNIDQNGTFAFDNNSLNIWNPLIKRKSVKSNLIIFKFNKND